MTIRYSLAVLTLILLPTVGRSQADLMILSKTLGDEAVRLKVEADSIATALGIPIRGDEPGGVTFELQKFENGRPFYNITDNVNSAATISTDDVYPAGSGGYFLTGSGVTLGEWDGGGVRSTHQELTGRVLSSQGALNFHSTHVAGTMIATGVSPTRKGMAYAASLAAFDWNSDDAEMAAQAGAGLRVSNHSYGTITGWRFNHLNDGQWAWFGNNGVSTSEDYLFGFYDGEARAWDDIANAAPYYLIVKSAGNDRDEGPNGSTSHWDFNGGFVNHVGSHSKDGNSGFDCINGAGISKNTLTVGAVNDIPGGYTVPAGVVMSSFSSWGPTDDGRIKPDVVANGVSLSSTFETADNAYGSLSGTSMAAPSVTGSIGLLLEYQGLLHGATPLRASTMKALVIHTADEAGSNDGPDYKFGWGLMNTLRAVQTMEQDTIDGTGSHITTVLLTNGDTAEVTVSLTGDDPLKATICWTESSGPAPPVTLDPTTSNLRNDIDLRVIEPDGLTAHQPWILNPALPNVGAQLGDNTRDNVEQVQVDATDRGLYTVRITHKGTLTGPITVSLIVTGNVGQIGPVISVAPDTAEFVLLPGESAIDSFKVYNSGDTNLVALVSPELSMFMITTVEDSINILPDDSGWVHYTIDDTYLSQWTVYEGNIELSSNDPVTPVAGFPVRVSVLGPDISNSPTAVFVDLDSAEIGYDTITVRNVGYTQLDVVISDTSGSFAPWFLIDTTSFSLAVGDSIRIAITTNSNNMPLETYLAVLKLASNDSATGDVLLPVLMNVGTRTLFQVQVEDRWNLMSLPVIPVDPSKETLFPSAITDAYGFDGAGYYTADSLETGNGYWMKFSGDDEFVLDGWTFSTDTINLISDWNMFGSLSQAVSVGSIGVDPPGSLTSEIYEYVNGYKPADSLLPGRGYWVQANQEASIYLQIPILAAQGQTASRFVSPATGAGGLTGLNKVTVTDDRGGRQELRFGTAGSAVRRAAGLPPPPPEGFDARFEGGKSIAAFSATATEAEKALLQVRSAGSKVTLEFRLVDTKRTYGVRDAEGNFRRVKSGSVISIPVDGPLSLELEAGPAAVPTEYALGQNYPNPFNPATEISFSLPSAERVTIVLYNVLGNEVAVVVDGQFDAGAHKVTFNAADLPTGVYMYRMTAGDFHASRKMMLVR